MDRGKQLLIGFIQSAAPVPLARAEEIAAHFTEIAVNKHDHFLKEGKVSSAYLFLTEGFMRAYAIDTNGNEITTGLYSRGSVVFEVSSFFTHVPSKENIQALTDCRGLMISFEQLNHLFHALPEFREFGRAVLVRGYAALKSRMLATITETAEERYLKLLQTNPDVFQQAPLKYIASYLGITDTSLSRIRKEVSKK